jgi:myo-inositol-1(or 4)-monophosphatase
LVSAPAVIALDLALEAARSAGELLVLGFGQFTDEKQGVSPGGALPLLGRRHRADAKSNEFDLVTEYDRRSEALLVAHVRAAFPADLVVAEEGGLRAPAEPAAPSTDGVARWLIDPLDGTTNFAHGLPFFCVSIAREVGGAVDVGVVHAPVLGLTFSACRGGGARLNGEALHVSDEESLARSLLATGFPTDRGTSADNNFAQFVALQRRARGVRRFGSAALDLALVAHGTFDGYWEMKLKPWDLAAGALLVREAGGRVSGWRGEPFASDRGAVVATNGRIHDALLDALATVGIPPSAR